MTVHERNHERRDSRCRLYGQSTVLLLGLSETNTIGSYLADSQRLTGYLAYPEGLPVQLDPSSIPSDSFHGAHMDITTRPSALLTTATTTTILAIARTAISLLGRLSDGSIIFRATYHEEGQCDEDLPIIHPVD